MNKSFILAEVKAVETENPNGAFEAILSAPTLDRDGEIIEKGAFEAQSPLPDSIPIHINHEFDVEKVVGRGVPYYDGELLKVKGVFDADARSQLVRSKIASGSVNRMSVGFMGAKKETKDGIRTITAAELLEASFVSVSSNREAAVLAIKSSKAGARNSAADADLIQGAHDNLVAVGATCDGGKAVRLIRTKTMVGSFEERQEEMSEALQSAYPDAWWVEIIATFDDRVVYEVHGGANDDMQFETPYSWDGDEVTFGTATPVDVNEVATPAPTGDTRSVSHEDTSGAGGDGTAREDAPGADGDDEQQHMALRARALQLLAGSMT